MQQLIGARINFQLGLSLSLSVLGKINDWSSAELTPRGCSDGVGVSSWVAGQSVWGHGGQTLHRMNCGASWSDCAMPIDGRSGREATNLQRVQMLRC